MGLEGGASKTDDLFVEGGEVVVVEFEEGVKFEVGGAPFGELGLVGDGDGDAFHAGCFGGDETVEGVFEGQALEGVGVEGADTVHVDLGVGFAVGKVFGGGDGFEVVADLQFVYDDMNEGKG